MADNPYLKPKEITNYKLNRRFYQNQHKNKSSLDHMDWQNKKNEEQGRSDRSSGIAGLSTSMTYDNL